MAGYDQIQVGPVMYRKYHADVSPHIVTKAIEDDLQRNAQILNLQDTQGHPVILHRPKRVRDLRLMPEMMARYSSLLRTGVFPCYFYAVENVLVYRMNLPGNTHMGAIQFFKSGYLVFRPYHTISGDDWMRQSPFDWHSDASARFGDLVVEKHGEVDYPARLKPTHNTVKGGVALLGHKPYRTGDSGKVVCFFGSTPLLFVGHCDGGCFVAAGGDPVDVDTIELQFCSGGLPACGVFSKREPSEFNEDKFYVLVGRRLEDYDDCNNFCDYFVEFVKHRPRVDFKSFSKGYDDYAQGGMYYDVALVAAYEHMLQSRIKSVGSMSFSVVVVGGRACPIWRDDYNDYLDAHVAFRRGNVLPSKYNAHFANLAEKQGCSYVQVLCDESTHDDYLRYRSDACVVGDSYTDLVELPNNLPIYNVGDGRRMFTHFEGDVFLNLLTRRFARRLRYNPPLKQSAGFLGKCYREYMRVSKTFECYTPRGSPEVCRRYTALFAEEVLDLPDGEVVLREFDLSDEFVKRVCNEYNSVMNRRAIVGQKALCGSACGACPCSSAVGSSTSLSGQATKNNDRDETLRYSDCNIGVEYARTEPTLGDASGLNGSQVKTNLVLKPADGAGGNCNLRERVPVEKDFVLHSYHHDLCRDGFCTVEAVCVPGEYDRLYQFKSYRCRNVFKCRLDDGVETERRAPIGSATWYLRLKLAVLDEEIRDVSPVTTASVIDWPMDRCGGGSHRFLSSATIGYARDMYTPTISFAKSAEVSGISLSNTSYVDTHCSSGDDSDGSAWLLYSEAELVVNSANVSALVRENLLAAGELQIYVGDRSSVVCEHRYYCEDTVRSVRLVKPSGEGESSSIGSVSTPMCVTPADVELISDQVSRGGDSLNTSLHCSCVEVERLDRIWNKSSGRLLSDAEALQWASKLDSKKTIKRPWKTSAYSKADRPGRRERLSPPMRNQPSGSKSKGKHKCKYSDLPSCSWEVKAIGQNSSMGYYGILSEMPSSDDAPFWMPDSIRMPGVRQMSGESRKKLSVGDGVAISKPKVTPIHISGRQTLDARKSCNRIRDFGMVPTVSTTSKNAPRVAAAGSIYIRGLGSTFHGSGFRINMGIYTAYHVTGSDWISDGKNWLPAGFIDRRLDFVAYNAKVPPAVSTSLTVGTDCWVLGPKNTLKVRFLTELKRNHRGVEHLHPGETAYAFSASADMSGYSGSAIVDATGALVGMVSSIISYESSMGPYAILSFLHNCTSITDASFTDGVASGPSDDGNPTPEVGIEHSAQVGNSSPEDEAQSAQLYKLHDTVEGAMSAKRARPGHPQNWLVASVGVGKTTGCLRYIFEHGMEAVMAFPTIAAVDNAENFYHKLGGRCTVRVKGEERGFGRVLLTTHKALLNMLVRRDNRIRHRLILVDEAHNQTVECSVLRRCLPSLCQQSLYISATPPGTTDWQQSTNYPIVDYKVKIDEAIRFVPDMVRRSKKILIFYHTKSLCDKAAHRFNSQGIRALPVYSDTVGKYKKRLDAGDYSVICATNALESSVTLDVDVVIDTGFKLEVKYL